EDRGDLPLPEGVVQGVVDRLWRDAEASDGVTVDLEHHARRGRLQIACYVLQLRKGGELRQHDRRPLEQLRHVGILQRVLVLRLAAPRTDLHVLACLPNSAMPGTTIAARRSRLITSVAVALRSASGLRSIMRRPVLTVGLARHGQTASSLLGDGGALAEPI